MSRYIIGDVHAGHNNISKFRKRSYFPSGEIIPSEEQHELLYEELAKIPKRATLFLMGDIAFTKAWLDRIKQLPCKNKVLFAGNHCTMGDITMRDLVDTYEKVYSLKKYKGFWMSHAPMHPCELYRGKSVHGHTHYKLVLGEDGEPDPNYISTCCEYTGYKPITWEFATSDEYRQECYTKWLQYKEMGRI